MEKLKIIRMVIDVMSPAQQSIVDLIGRLDKLDNITRVDISLSELEKNVEDFKVTILGSDLDYERINNAIKDFGAVIRNVDNITSSNEGSNQDNNRLSASMLVLAKHIDSGTSKISQINSEFDEALKYIQSKNT